MADLSIEKAVLNELATMAMPQQRQVLEYARALSQRKPTGVRGTRLLHFAGLLSQADLNEMAAAIRDHERVDDDEW